MVENPRSCTAITQYYRSVWYHHATTLISPSILPLMDFVEIKLRHHALDGGRRGCGTATGHQSPQPSKHAT